MKLPRWRRPRLDTSGTGAAPAGPTETPQQQVAPANETPPVEPSPEAANEGEVEAREAAPALRSLDRYKKDPAFQNFMDKARRPPGTVGRRPGRGSSFDPPRD